MGVYDIRKWKVFRKVAAISGIVQGFTWLIMAAICIGLYYGSSFGGVKDLYNLQVYKGTNYIDLISFGFYDSLLNQTNNQEHSTLKPQNFHIFVWVYVFLSIFWFSLSVGECLVIFRRGSRKYEAHVLMLSGVITIITCVLDIVLMSLAFYEFYKINIFDYNHYYNVPGTDPLDDFRENIDTVYRYTVGRKLSFGILATICARGFTLWIFNCVTGIILILISMKVFQSPPILLYDNKSIPRPKIQLASKKSSDNSYASLGGAEDRNNYYTTPPSEKKRYSLPNSGRYGGQPNKNNPLALHNRSEKNENLFF